MKRITTNDDIRFPIRVVKGLDSDIFTIQFYTTSKAVCLTKTNADVEDGIIHLEWTELYPLGTGVMNYTVLIPEADGSYSDDTFNKSISGTTIFYIVSDIIVPDGDEAQELVEVVADLQTQVNANTAKIEELMRVTITSSNWSATALRTPDTRYIISGNLDFDSATEVEVGDNCQIEFTKGSTLGSNVELLINNAEIVAPLTQIFDGTKITGFFHNGQIPVEWFGAKGDGETDDAEAINTTIKYAGKSEVLLSAPIYVIGSTIDINETNANFDSYEGQVEAARGEEGGKKFLCKGSIYSTSDFTGYTVGNVTVPAMIRLAASNATVRIEGAIVVHADLTNCIGFLHEGFHDNKVYIARVMKARDYIGLWSWWNGTNTYTNQALMNLGTCDGVVYIYAMGTDFECEQICGFNNAFMVSDKYATAYAGVQQASFKFASLTANYGIRVKVGNNDGLIHPTTSGWMNACRIEYNGISGDNESRRFIPNTDATFIKVDSGTTGDHFSQNKIICNSVEPVWYKLMDINRGRSNYFELLGNFGDCHIIPYINGVPDDKNLGESAPTECYNRLYPYTDTNQFINIRNSKDFLINNLTPFYPMPYDTIYVHNSSNIVFTNCQSVEYLKDNWYQYVDSARRFEKVIFTCSDITDLTSTDITVFEPDSREMDTIAYVESANNIDLTVDRLNIVTTPAYTTKFNSYPLYQVIEGVKSQLGYCYDYKGLIASNNTLEEALSHVTVDAYTKAETNTLLAGKANKNGSANETFSTSGLNLQRDGAATTLYNYVDNNNKEYVSFYDRTGGSLTYQFTANQGDNIATERQLALKANSADVYTKNEVYTKSETYTKGEVNNLIPELPNNIVTDANYVHTDNNFTTTLKNKLDGIASGAEVNVQANWNETNSSSDAYIRNKPTIPTIDSTITGSSQANAVQGGAIYTALSGKAGYKYYNSYQEMEVDSPANGTIGFDGDGEEFYIFDSPNAEWKKIENAPIVNSITSGSPNAVQGGTIYTALAGKAGYRWYSSYNNMIADSPANGTIGFDGDNENFYIYDEGNGEWKPIDQTGGGGGGSQVQSNWNESDTSSPAYIQNKPTIPTKTSDLTNDSNFVDATNDLNVINATTVKFYDGISDYVAITGDADANFDCNTLRFSDLYSGNEVLFSMAPGGYRLNLGDWRHSIGTLPAAVDGVSTVELQPGYTIFTSRWRANAVDISLTLNTPTYSNIVTNEYYVYIPGTTATIRCTGITFDFETEGITSVLWKDGVAPDIVSEMKASSVVLTYLLKFINTGSVLLAEYSVFKEAT